MAKIPVIESGLQAIEELVMRDVPLCATEVFSVTQSIEVCERYQHAARRSGNHPPFFVTHITGILDQYLGQVAAGERIDIGPELLAQAGSAIARKEYRILKQRAYEGTMLGGGVRGLQHFTEFVGGDIHITMNWSTMQELIELDGPVMPRMDVATPPEVIEELSDKLPNFRRAFYEGAIHTEEFADFGPLVFFRAMFLNGYSRLLDEVAERRARLAAGI
jgi:transaldolase